MHRENDVYRQLSEGLLYLYNIGKCYHAYRNFGAHIVDDGVQFTLWAPGVKSVRVLGDFNDWGYGTSYSTGAGQISSEEQEILTEGQAIPTEGQTIPTEGQAIPTEGQMIPPKGKRISLEAKPFLRDEDFYLEPLGTTGVYTGFIPGIGAGTKYKFDIEHMDGKHVLKADPFAFQGEKRPGTASIVCDLSYSWNDDSWMKKRESRDVINGPVNIYEVHPGSWKRHPIGSARRSEDNEDGFYSYEELADTLIPYVKDMGYNYIAMLPVMEHPLDASWGYQVTGYYAASSRYGHPTGLMRFIDTCHSQGIGMIIDWVPGHFCPDEQGLACFNGGSLYEREIHPDWGTYKFDFARSEVRSFLLSNAMFWAEKYHIDGIRVDGVSSMLYLNFGVTDPGRMKYNKYGGDGDLDAIAFVKEFNQMMGTSYPGIMTCAEESSTWPLVTMPPEDGGLGFHFKWNMGWMNDTLDFMATDFIYRSYHHNKLTFALTYAFSENFILPLSHDEVVHGKRSMMGRMPGSISQQFSGVKLLAMYQMTHPGKKLNFMGHEIAPFIEWREYEELEWFLLKYENHAAYQNYIRELNHIYLEHEALWQKDTSWEGFQWIDPDNAKQNILSFLRCGTEARETLLTVLNFNVQQVDHFRIGVPGPGTYKEIMNSNAREFGGDDRMNESTLRAEKIPMHGREWSIEIRMPVLGGAIFQWIPDRKAVKNDILRREEGEKITVPDKKYRLRVKKIEKVKIEK